MASKVYWLSPLTGCDLCQQEFGNVMYDARVGGPWGNICQPCFTANHCRTGQGYGQKYEKQDDGKFLKTEG